MPPNPTTYPIGFAATCARATLYILLVAALLQGAYLEALYLDETRFTERGYTELTQSALLASVSLLLIYTRQVLKAAPTLTLLLFAFAFSSLIREQDAWLDIYVAKHTWKVLVALVIVPTLYWVIQKRHQFLEEFAAYSNTFSFGLFASGFLVTYVFSRLYGRSEMWMAILGEHYQRTFKDAAEEITELLGYSLILIAAIELVLLARRWQQARSTP
ncbi:hypothetical protein F0A17_10195 [Billgrantia pellis]|uniref:Uncharacterized protein n=1 Tax=Billgrantia pellis TaxID=2606936 RepID=A0A7V7FZ21_9GAMM|nr:hypothetical protein [Halomonas pellis]KAA0011694.1 hypothetical protein F0A17_10195 [Halomonas pellis]